MFTELVLAPLTTMDPTCAVDYVSQLASHVVPTLVSLTPPHPMRQPVTSSPPDLHIPVGCDEGRPHLCAFRHLRR